MGSQPADQLVPHMGPPVLTDHAAGFSLAQMPAILAYLGGKHGLIPDDPARDALTDKIVADANDVLYEMTLHNGAQMWTQESWSAYRPRLARWMEIFEATGRRYGLTVGAGHLLGTETPGVADLTVYVLWGTMTAKLPPLRPLLEETAPAIANLSDRIAALPEQADLRAQSDEKYGDEWCRRPDRSVPACRALSGGPPTTLQVFASAVAGQRSADKFTLRASTDRR